MNTAAASSSAFLPDDHVVPTVRVRTSDDMANSLLQAKYDYETFDIESLFDSPVKTIRDLDEGLAPLVQLAGDPGRGLLTRSRAAMQVRDLGWSLEVVKHPNASHALLPLNGKKTGSPVLLKAFKASDWNAAR